MAKQNTATTPTKPAPAPLAAAVATSKGDDAIAAGRPFRVREQQRPIRSFLAAEVQPGADAAEHDCVSDPELVRISSNESLQLCRVHADLLAKADDTAVPHNFSGTEGSLVSLTMLGETIVTDDSFASFTTLGEIIVADDSFVSLTTLGEIILTDSSVISFRSLDETIILTDGSVISFTMLGKTIATGDAFASFTALGEIIVIDDRFASFTALGETIVTDDSFVSFTALGETIVTDDSFVSFTALGEIIVTDDSFASFTTLGKIILTDSSSIVSNSGTRPNDSISNAPSTAPVIEGSSFPALLDLLLSWDGHGKLPNPLKLHFEGRPLLLYEDGRILCPLYDTVQWPPGWQQRFQAFRITTNGGKNKDHQEVFIRLLGGHIPLQPMEAAARSSVPVGILYADCNGKVALRHNETGESVEIVHIGRIISLTWSKRSGSVQQIEVPVSEWQVLQARVFRIHLRIICHTHSGIPAAQLSLSPNGSQLAVSFFGGILAEKHSVVPIAPSAIKGPQNLYADWWASLVEHWTEDARRQG